MFKGSVDSQGPWREGENLHAASRNPKPDALIARKESGLEYLQAESQ